MAEKLKKLEFLIGVRDGVTTKIGKIQKSIEGMTKHVEGNFRQAAAGIGTAWAGAKSAMAMLDPGRELNRSLAGLEALDVGATALGKLQSDAQSFATQYGGSAADIIASTYDIKRSFAGLKDTDLGAVATSSAVLAKAVKADGKAVTGYMAAMRQQYAKEAAAMGDARWIENLSGQTAAAIRQFGASSVEQYQAAFAALGKQKVAMPEQLAVLGVAQQAGMNGTDAGAAYKKSLAGMDKLGLQLGVDVRGADGELMAMDKILASIRAKHKGIVSEDTLAEILGGDKNAAKLMYSLQKNQAALAKGMTEIGKNKGLGAAADMAAKLADPLDRASAAGANVRASLGQKLMPVIGRVADVATGFLNTINGWINRFPTLTKWVGVSVIVLLSLVSVMGTLAAAVGLSKLAMAGMALSGKSAIGVFGLLGKAVKIYTGLQWLMNSALWANPITWIVGGVLLLIAAVAALVYWWDEIVDAFLDTAWGKALMLAIEGIGAALNWLADIIPAIGRALYEHFMGRIKAIAGGIMWILEKLGIIDAEEGGLDAPQDKPEPKPAPVPAMLAATSRDNVPEGGIRRDINNTVNNAGSRDNVTNVGEVHNHFEQKVSRDEMSEFMLMST